MLTKSVALRLAKWTCPIPDDRRDKAEEILVAAARAGADLRSLAAICAEIRYQTAEHDPDDEKDKDLDRGVSFDTTFDGAGVIHGDLTPECAAMVQAVLDALEHQILSKVLQVVSGPGGVASFLRRNLLGKGLNGPSLPLDVGQP